jgi:hypothetical protein
MKRVTTRKDGQECHVLGHWCDPVQYGWNLHHSRLCDLYLFPRGKNSLASNSKWLTAKLRFYKMMLSRLDCNSHRERGPRLSRLAWVYTRRFIFSSMKRSGQRINSSFSMRHQALMATTHSGNHFPQMDFCLDPILYLLPLYQDSLIASNDRQMLKPK